MEGIAGIVYPDVFQISHLLNPMLNMMEHRGGDAQDSILHKNIHIGINGGKLVFNEKKSIAIAFSGAIYNYEELYTELKKHGPVPHHLSHSTQLLVQAYELWGTDCIAKLNGDFAFAIFDQHKERLVLARDRIGKKPLYWYQDQNTFLFASELKALLATGSVAQTPSEDAIASYLYFGYIPQDLTPIKNVNKLLPGYFLQFNRDKSLSIQSYWSYSSYFEKKNRASKTVVAKQLNDLLLKAIKARLPRNALIGCFISGGLGSAAIADYLHQLVPQNHLYAYSSGFQGQNDPDIQAANEVAKILEIPHIRESLTPTNFLDQLVPIAWHLDEPLADPNVISTWRMAKMAAEKTTTVFSGMGSDEFLAGHSRYSLEERQVGLSSKFFQYNLNLLKTFLLPLLNYVYPRASYELLKKSRTNPWQFDFLRHNAVFDEGILALAAPKLSPFFDPDVFLHKFHNLIKIKSTVSSFLYLDVKTRLADCYVLQLERLTAAHNLEWTPPFLDHHLIEYLAGLSEPDLLTEKETAIYLKTLLKDVFPNHILNRPKRTRPDFLKSWANTPELKSIWTLLAKGTLVEMGYISETWLNLQIEKPQRCENSFKYLWSILMLEIWMRLFISRSIQPKAPDISVRELLSES